MEHGGLDIAILILMILIPLFILALVILINVLIIQAIIKYAARKFAEENAKQQQKVFEQQANYFAAQIAKELRASSAEESFAENKLSLE